MKKLGKALHCTPSRLLILRSTSLVEIGTKVLNRRGTVIGEVCNVFGPTSNPYIAVRPLKVENIEQYVGKALYAEES